MKTLTFLYEKVYRKIDSVIDVIVILSQAGMVLSLLTNLILRFITGREIPALNEISLMCFLWATYVCCGQLYRINAHIRIDFVLSRLPSKLRDALEVLNTAINSAVIGYFAYFAWKLMFKSFTRTLNITRVPYAYMHLAIGIGFTLMALYAFSDLIVQIINLFRKGNPLPTCEYTPVWKEGVEE